MMLALHAAIAKNLRGIVLLNPIEDKALDTLRWLAKRFKYRDLGFTPSLSVKLKAYSGGFRSPFRELVYPSASFEKLVEVFAGKLQIPLELSELLIFSSIYISPAILIGESYRPYIESISCYTVKTRRYLTISDWKLHMRIVGYAILDFYEDSIEESLEAIKNPREYTSIIEKRRIKIAKDTRRYWRIAAIDGRSLVYYVDNLELAFKTGIREIESDWIAGLSIVTIINITSDLARI
jgi:hypothetical protein